MALSKFQKGFIGLGIAAVAVVAVGYGGMRYLENAVIEAIRTWAAQTPENARVEIGDASYTLMKNDLVLKNVRLHYVAPTKQNMDITVESLDIQNPGTTLLSLMHDPKSEIKEAELPVADAVVLNGLSLGPEPRVAVRSRTIHGITLSADAVKTLLAAEKPSSAQIVLSLIYGLSYKDDAAVGISMESTTLPFTFSCQSSRQTDYAKGHLDSSVASGMSFAMKGQNLLSLGELRMENLNLPPRSLMEKLFSAPETLDDKEAFNLAKSIFTGPKPFVGSLSLAELKTSSSLLDLSLSKLSIKNPSTEPYAFDVSVEHLKLPVALVPELQILSLMGVAELDASASYSLTLPNKDNQFDTTASLSLAEFGTADLAIKGELPYEAFSALLEQAGTADDPGMEEALQAFIHNNLTLSSFAFGYADEGLLPRLAILGQKFMGLSPEQGVSMAKKYVREEFGPTATREDVEKLDAFIDKPGAIRFTFAPQKPLSAEAIAALPPDSPDFRLEVTPGPKTVQELMTALETK